MPAKSKAQQRFMGMVHAAQKGELDNPSAEVEKAADSMSDADAKDYASTKHKGLPNHVKKENMEKELKEIIRQTYRESLRESINEDAAELPQATIPSAVKIRLQFAIDKIQDSKLSNNAKLQLLAQVIDALDIDKSQLSTIANKIRSKMESVNEAKYPTDLKIGSVIKGQGFTMLRGIEGGRYYKIVDMDDTTATLTRTDPSGKVSSPTKVRHKLDSIEGSIKTAKRGDENGIVVIKESVNETISHEAMGIASMTNTRKEAVQKFIDDNDLNALEILKIVTKGGLVERVRFIQALVGTPNNSSFKWYVKNYANEGVVTEAESDIKVGDMIKVVDNPHWEAALGKKGPFKRKVKKIDHDNVFFTDGSNSSMKYIVKESVVNEDKKAFRINPPIGKAKYSISAHDGIAKHKDGSPFWDILIFKNKADLERRANYFRGEKYIEESVNESLIKEDVYKSILSDNKGKMFFSIVDADTKDVKFLDAKTWIQSTIKDKASDSSKELVLTAMAKQITQFNKKVDFNMWVNANKPTWEEKIKYLLDKGLVKNVNRGGIKVH